MPPIPVGPKVPPHRMCPNRMSSHPQHAHPETRTHMSTCSHTGTNVSVHKYTHEHTHRHRCVCTRIHAHECRHMCEHTHNTQTCAPTHACVCTYTHTFHTHKCTPTHTRTHEHILTCIHACMPPPHPIHRVDLRETVYERSTSQEGFRSVSTPTPPAFGPRAD